MIFLDLGFHIKIILSLSIVCIVITILLLHPTFLL